MISPSDEESDLASTAASLVAYLAKKQEAIRTTKEAFQENARR